MTWALGHLGLVLAYLRSHTMLAVIPLVLGLVIAVPLGRLAMAAPGLRAVVVGGTGLLYTIPSLAMFVLLPGLIGTDILSPVNVVIALTIYSVALLVRTVVDGLSSVPQDVLAAATAMGLTGVRRFVEVELPLAIPVVVAGLRVAAVSNVSIASVAALLGIEQLGMLFTDGFDRRFLDPIVTGIVACVLLALALDLVILGLGRVLAPWQRQQQAQSVGAGS